MAKQPLSRGRDPMRAALWLAVGAFAVVAGGLAHAVPGPYTARPAPLAGPTVILESDDGVGSGVAIGGGWALTAAHVVGNPGKWTVKDDMGVVHPGFQVMWSNTEYDLALIKFDGPVKPAKLACRAPINGEPIVVIGNPFGIGIVTTRGFISSLPMSAEPNWRSVMTLDATVRNGNSGGPVFDVKGEVVGIAVGLLAPPNTPAAPVALAVPSSVACMLMARAA